MLTHFFSNVNHYFNKTNLEIEENNDNINAVEVSAFDLDSINDICNKKQIKIKSNKLF